MIIRAKMAGAYHKKQSEIGHGWEVRRPNGTFLCWLSDAAVADRLVDELNDWKKKHDEVPVPRSPSDRKPNS